ncbi:MAG: hypothetical protein HC871_02115 [Rhizobiales bacterium]|nr:hypothetical protein [Hyphomicrobiales bacterium]
MSADLVAELRAFGLNSDALAALPDGMRQPIEDHLLSSRALVFGIEAEARSTGGAVFIRRATVALEAGERGRPFAIFAWEQGDADGFAASHAAYQPTGRTQTSHESATIRVGDKLSWAQLDGRHLDIACSTASASCPLREHKQTLDD